MASDADMNLPIVDLDIFLSHPPSSPAVQAECARAADALVTYGALILHDSRVPPETNDQFLDLLEDYCVYRQRQGDPFTYCRIDGSTAGPDRQDSFRALSSRRPE